MVQREDGPPEVLGWVSRDVQGGFQRVLGNLEGTHGTCDYLGYSSRGPSEDLKGIQEFQGPSKVLNSLNNPQGLQWILKWIPLLNRFFCRNLKLL